MRSELIARHGWLAGGVTAAIAFAALQLVPAPRPTTHLIPPASWTRAQALSEREEQQCCVPTSLATSTTRQPRAERRSVRLLAPSTRPAVRVDYTEIDGMPRTLRRIGGCESSGRADGPLIWTAQNPGSTASGAFQVLDSTWWSPKGTGWSQVYGADVHADQYARAKYAPPDVQLHVVLAAFNRQGTGPWNSSRGCWG